VDIKKIYWYPHNGDPTGYRYEYRMDIYLADRVRES